MFIRRFLAFLALPSLILTVWFYLAPIPQWAYLAVPIIIVIGAVFMFYKDIREFVIRAKASCFMPHAPRSMYSIISNTAFWFTLTAILVLVLKGATNNYLPTVWAVLDYKFWLILSVNLVSLVWSMKESSQTNNLIKFGALLFVLFNLANIIYRLGFGYDTFIHQATEKLLLTTGTISPKPPLYIGYYTFVLWLSRITAINYELVDRFIPFLISAIAIPAGLSSLTKSNWPKLLFLIVPFSLLTVPTPQSLSLGLLICLFYFLAENKITKNNLLEICALSLWALAIHPLSAFPIFILIGFKILHEIKLKYKWTLGLAGLVFSSILYPLAFILANKISSNSIKLAFRLPDWNSLLSLITKFQYDFPKDFAYFIADIIPLAILIFSVIVVIKLIKEKKSEWHPLILTCSALIINCLILIFFANFDSLQINEKYFFIQRIITITLYSLLPFIIFWIQNLQMLNVPCSMFNVAFLFSVILSSIYVSYPRYDHYQPTKLYNVTQGTFDAVKSIGENEKEFVVLGDQMTGAVAIKLFGFEHEILTADGQMTYFYPVPTGNHLHSLYEQTLWGESPALAIAEAKKYTQKKTIYVVLNRSFRNSESIDLKLSKITKERIDVEDYLVYKF